MIYELEMTPQDVGEMVEMIRIQYLKMNDEVFCSKLKITPKLLFTVEEGKGPHGLMVLRKINKVFPHVKVGITVEF
jgi:hypothetical protein